MSVRVSQEAVTLLLAAVSVCDSARVCAVVVEGSCALQYFERSGFKLSERLGMVMEMESGDSFTNSD